MVIIYRTIHLASGIRLRREYFGGLVYDTRNGNILEVDKSTFELLNLIKDATLKVQDVITFLVQNNIIRKHDKYINPLRCSLSNGVNRTLQTLFALKIIEERPESSQVPTFINGNLNKINHKPWLSAPETLHWAVTYQCDKNCPDCYTGRFSYSKKELETGQALKLIDKVADWGVFQLAIGGGEPFLRKDLLEILSHAKTRGLSVHVTTGNLDIDPLLLKSVCPLLNNLQLGIQPDDIIGQHSQKSIQQIQNLFTAIQGFGITPGANLFLTKSSLEQLENLIKIFMDIGFNRIILLRYKPPESIEQWKRENPDINQLKGLYQKINNIIKEYPQLNIRIDCALSFVQRNLTKELASHLGIKGCVAGDRILAVTPDGSVYPCSQLVHPDCYVGNLLESEPELLWDQSQVLRKYRSFRTKKVFKNSWCGVCLAKYHCGGCRVFTSDGLGGDMGCPEPLLPPVTQLGKIGRQLELVEYLKNHGTISVEEYMNRYGVSQRKAIKELNTSPSLVSTTGKSAKKKKDIYQYVENDIILDIQESIGSTSGGVPFVSYEQTSEWIKDTSYTNNYPKKKKKMKMEE